MGYHMHLRAVPASEVRLDHAWLEEFMLTCWDSDVHPAEYAAGIAVSIQKDFDSVNGLYETAGPLPEAPDSAWELPVYGGDLVHHPAEEQPPFADVVRHGLLDVDVLARFDRQ